MTKNHTILILSLLLATVILVVLIGKQILYVPINNPVKADITPTPIKINQSIIPAYISEDNTDISKWQKFTNTRYGFSIKYPRNWVADRSESNLTDDQLQKAHQIMIIPKDTAPGMFFLNVNGTNINQEVYGVNIGDYVNRCIDLEECARAAVPAKSTNVYYWKDKFLENDSIIVAYTLPDLRQSFFERFVILKNNYYRFTLTAGESDIVSIRSTMFAILNSFEFTK